MSTQSEFGRGFNACLDLCSSKDEPACGKAVREYLREQIKALPYLNAGAWVKRRDVLNLLGGESE